MEGGEKKEGTQTIIVGALLEALVAHIPNEQGRGELLQAAKVTLFTLLRLRLPSGFRRANSQGSVANKQDVTFAKP